MDNNWTLEAISQLLLITPRRIQQLANENIVQKTERGQYALVQSVRGYIRYLNDQIPNKATSAGGSTVARVDAEVERAKYLKHKAELTRMEEEEKKGILVNADTMRHEAFRIGRTVQTSILNIPARLAQDLAIDTDPNSIHRKLETELRHAMLDIANLIDGSNAPFALPLDPAADCHHWLWLEEETA